MKRWRNEGRIDTPRRRSVNFTGDFAYNSKSSYIYLPTVESFSPTLNSDHLAMSRKCFYSYQEKCGEAAKFRNHNIYQRNTVLQIIHEIYLKFNSYLIPYQLKIKLESLII